MITTISMTEEQLAKIDAARKLTGETRSAYLVRKSGGAERPPSRRQLTAIAKRARAAILGHS